MAVDWFLEAKKAYAEVLDLKRQLHEARGLWYGACAARTEKAVEVARLEREIARLRARE